MDRCNAALEKHLDTKQIKHFLHVIRLNGDKHGLRGGITCKQCQTSDNHPHSKGYYDAGAERVVICHDNINARSYEQDMEDTLRHELVHAFDSRTLNRRQPRQPVEEQCKRLVCTEIRASLLGQCRRLYGDEQRKCIERDVLQSVAS